MNEIEIAIAKVLPDLFESSTSHQPAERSGGGLIPEGRRNSSLTQTAGRLRRIGMSGSTIAAALHAENQQRCVPPLSFFEVEEIAYSVSRYPPDAAASKVVVAAETLPFATAKEVSQRTTATPPWFVPGFVAPGVITEVDGKLKASGKTTFFAQMVSAILSGRQFLGRPTRRSAAVWLTEERQATFLAALNRAGLADRDDLHILFWHDVKSLPWADVVSMAAAHAVSTDSGILIVDTIGQWAGLRGDAENNNGDQLTAVEPLQSAAGQGLAVVVGRHERKGGGEVGESGRGGSAFSGAVDVIVSIRRGEGKTKPTVRLLHTLSRFDETPDTLTIDLTEHGYVAVEGDGTAAVSQAERRLLDMLPHDERAAVDMDTLEAAGLTRTVAQTAIKNLVATNRIVRVGSGRKGNPYRWFRQSLDAAATEIT